MVTVCHLPRPVLESISAGGGGDGTDSDSEAADDEPTGIVDDPEDVPLPMLNDMTGFLVEDEDEDEVEVEEGEDDVDDVDDSDSNGGGASAFAFSPAADEDAEFASSFEAKFDSDDSAPPAEATAVGSTSAAACNGA